MTGLTTTTTVSTQVGLIQSNAPFNADVYGETFQIQCGFSFGTGMGKANSQVVNVITITAGGTTTVTISSGLTNKLGQAATFTKIKEFIVELIPNADGSTPSNQVTVGNAGTHPWPSNLGSGVQTFTVFQGGWNGWGVGPSTLAGGGAKTLPPAYVLANNAITVTAASADQILFTNNDGSNVATVRYRLTGEA